MSSALPFTSTAPVRTAADVRRLAADPLVQSVPVRSIYELLDNSTAAFGDEPAISFVHDPADLTQLTRLTYRELLTGCRALANLLHRLGVGPQDAVSILMPASPEYHLALWGSSFVGMAQPLNPLLSEEKLATLMRAAGSRVLIVWGADEREGYWSRALGLMRQIPELTAVIRVAPPQGSQGPEPDDGPVKILDFATAVAAEPGDRLIFERTVAREDIAVCLHTGGTTSSPRLARLSHGAIVFTAWACVQMQGLTRRNVSIIGYPLYHAAGALTTSLPLLASGGHIVIPTIDLFRNRAVVSNYWRMFEHFGATELSAVPTALSALADVPLDGADISTLRYCRTGAAPLTADLAERVERTMGVHVHECLGMTETAGITTVTPPGVNGPAGCVGLVPPYAEIRIVAADPDGRATDLDLPVGRRGLILYRAPNLFSGYVGGDDSDGLLPGGWLDTGDMGWLDADERLNFGGRAKDLIIRSGHNIDPRAIESALLAHPEVATAAAVGAPDAYAGEVPAVFVTLVPGARATREELLAHAARTVDEPPARPKRLTILEALPVTPVGKLYKPALRHLATIEVLTEQLEEVIADRDIDVTFETTAPGRVDLVLSGDAALTEETAGRARALLSRLGVTGQVTTRPRAAAAPAANTPVGKEQPR